MYFTKYLYLSDKDYNLESKSEIFVLNLWYLVQNTYLIPKRVYLYP